MCLLVIYKVFCAQGYAQLPRSPVTFMPQWGRIIHSCCFPGLSCSCQKTCFLMYSINIASVVFSKGAFFYYFKFLLSVCVRVRVAELRCCEWVSEWVSDATFDFITRVTSSLHVRFFLLCCHSDTAYNKRLLSSLKPYALFVFFLLTTQKQTNRDTHAHPAPHKHAHTHTHTWKD